MADLKHRFWPLEILEPVHTQRLDAGKRRQLIAAKIVSRCGEKQLSPMAGREQARHAVERRSEIVAVAHFDRARMKRHPYFEIGRLGPRLTIECALRLERRGERVWCGVK